MSLLSRSGAVHICTVWRTSPTRWRKAFGRASAKTLGHIFWQRSRTISWLSSPTQDTNVIMNVSAFFKETMVLSAAEQWSCSPSWMPGTCLKNWWRTFTAKAWEKEAKLSSGTLWESRLTLFSLLSLKSCTTVNSLLFENIWCPQSCFLRILHFISGPQPSCSLVLYWKTDEPWHEGGETSGKEYFVPGSSFRVLKFSEGALWTLAHKFLSFDSYSMHILSSLLVLNISLHLQPQILPDHLGHSIYSILERRGIERPLDWKKVMGMRSFHRLMQGENTTIQYNDFCLFSRWSGQLPVCTSAAWARIVENLRGVAIASHNHNQQCPWAFTFPFLLLNNKALLQWFAGPCDLCLQEPNLCVLVDHLLH